MARRSNKKRSKTKRPAGGVAPAARRSPAAREIAAGNVSGAGFHESSRYGKRERRQARRVLRDETEER